MGRWLDFLDFLLGPDYRDVLGERGFRLLGCTVAVVLAVVISMGLFLGCAILMQDSY